jgi:hypothetical protein
MSHVSDERFELGRPGIYRGQVALLRDLGRRDLRIWWISTVVARGERAHESFPCGLGVLVSGVRAQCEREMERVVDDESREDLKTPGRLGT